MTCTALAITLIGNSAEVKLAPHVFTVPDGYTVELVAGTNLVQRPVSASFDDKGRLYVTDSSGSNAKTEEQARNPDHRVLRLEDTDGDGRFDKSVVFADKVMFPQGCLWHDGSVYVAGPPSIWKFTDTDGDGVSDKREEWFKGGTLTGCANDIHGPYLGPDSYLYWTKGAFAEQTHKLGNGRTLKDKAAHIYRARPDGSDLDVIMSGGMDNPVEVAFTSEGEPIFTSTFIDFSQPGYRDGIAHAVYGGVFGKENDVLEDGRVKRTGPDLLHPFVQLGPGVPSGLCRVYSPGSGGEFKDRFFSTCFNLHKVARHELEREGASYRGTTSDFLVSDNLDFHPTDVLQDADLTLLVIDTGGWYKLCCPSSQLAKPDVMGSIYRVRRSDVRRSSFGDLLLNYRSLTGPEMSPDNAMEIIFKKRSWRKNPEDEKSLRAFLEAYARGGPADVRRPAPHLLRLAAEAAGRIGSKASVTALLAAQEKSPAQDPVLQHSFIYALIQIAAPAETRPGLKSSVPVTQRAALVALDQMEGGDLKASDVLPFLRAQDDYLRDAAIWIYRRHPEWASEGAAFARELLSGSQGGEQKERLVRMLAVSPAVQVEIAKRLDAAPSAEKARLLDAVTEARPKEFAPEWVAVVRTVLGDKDHVVAGAAVNAVRALSPDAKKPHPAAKELQPFLATIARDTPRPMDLRLDALLAIAGPLDGINAALLDLAIDALDAARTPATRARALQVLQRATFRKAELLKLADALPRVGPLELPRLLTVFEQLPDEELGRKLLSILGQARAAKSLPAASVRTLFAKFPAAVQTAAASLIASLDADAAKQAARLDALLAELKSHPGDIRRGQTIFNSSKAACAACHKIGYLGGNIGPDLTRISEARGERDLLEGIVYPSASFVRSYEPVIVATKSGEEHSGVLRKDAPDELVIATGANTEVRLARADVAELRPGAVSVMPQGLDEQLSKQELADLLAFLRNTKWGPQ
ncbi:MAG TPA: PVC-type heme-binding CxxCH protein [Verrucomicrobiae bacterium]|nr:PVC-type heme-binding CxxCH protein [Verrucomicrobiae bacterium]